MHNLNYSERTWFYCYISSDMKQRTLQFLEQGWEIEGVAEVLGVSSKIIGR
jgi:hypothetical protein